MDRLAKNNCSLASNKWFPEEHGIGDVDGDGNGRLGDIKNDNIDNDDDDDLLIWQTKQIKIIATSRLDFAEKHWNIYSSHTKTITFISEINTAN